MDIVHPPKMHVADRVFGKNKITARGERHMQQCILGNFIHAQIAVRRRMINSEKSLLVRSKETFTSRFGANIDDGGVLEREIANMG